LPTRAEPELRPRFRFASWLPKATPWQDVSLA
jgi:hypothetical protein